MKLTAFSPPIFQTIQGEGASVGTVALFVRLWGCDFSCSWCDTKDSWRPGSKYYEKSVGEVLSIIKDFDCPNVVFTGGNPMLQGSELEEVILSLGDRYTTTIETQGSVYHRVAKYCDLLSISPKLHELKTNQSYKSVLFSLIAERGYMCQLKVVVEDVNDAKEALTLFNAIESLSGGKGPEAYILQPEYNKGKSWLVALSSMMASGQIRSASQAVFSKLRVIPQLHKMVYGVP